MYKIRSKRFGAHLIIIALVVIVLFLFARISTVLRQPPSQPIRYGITYSTVYAWYLGLDVMKSYQDLVENLGVRVVRLPVYWPDIEPEQGKFDWHQLDQFVKYSEQHEVKLTLAIGRKVPRWPECFVPNWAQKLSRKDQEQATRDMMEAIVTRYRISSTIVSWQVENEPFLPFGVCEQITKEDLQGQIDLVRRLDTKPVQLTASGEMNPWGSLARMGDKFGFSLYRKTWNSVFGYFTYPLPPLFYRLRTALIRLIGKPVIVSELQTEPWFSEDLKDQSTEYWYNVFTAEDFAENIRFVEEIGVSEVDLWGAEWWAYLKAHGEERLWKEAEKLFREETK
ncbi:hypothetical protein A3C09_01665 [Candidatus Uhrbacteria bacterium RIFCSPHIGHO2_02_FULL_47_44]|uniref:Glycoside hydrolase family 5 domain-containing protein n=1 Tax=Candidatus Uhrbacteria bacterium RIFCSPLOWO2_02_FULL_48_18 TaxID=1802408 RepID=A0A1F7V9R3_9BACT|nr:MAG: hypothetical protein A2839_03935 [Candidatus Uhrbacteria bacterium RIFCSPHIGHO2_01_FULL_47_10]OGL69942.1 MAG: hypothetical protein A3C09_01665 [Candidatus Uhrbacteria bacterium RIFCSPHIGHO2_02_FULL_47_44]OGL75913.1 MAG: hypothetical protein A3E97_03710 [Candidatus Uhrbacteria bacterium RIFCSPHIGHO2_12_FULL_47_12]OGL82204.1 MAG: hypothetical protein A3B20_00405 [Candidatus Uhrbacteria bacterium RIFCSPLOWO2_01_FULL_47_17]OGL86694.1 MAG: hypothetical protein A3I41_05170 [Candidatus Uhrbact